MFRGNGPQPRFGERSSLAVQAEPRATWSGLSLYFAIARARPGESIEVRVVNSQGSVVVQGTIEADTNGDVEYLMPWPYPSGEYRLVVGGQRSGKAGSQSFRV
jgi:hypothetical protein